ncbi:Na+/H+ antiporter subunit E [Kaarinaea lacus]
MKHITSLGILLFSLWLGLSGHMEPLLLSLGLASTFLTLYLSHRMDVVDHESHPIHLTSRLLRFTVYLWREIVVANWDVVKRIVTPGKSISPQMIEVPLPQRTNLGRVIYANAITLTPGTVSVRVNKDTITVHALAKETAEALSTGDMAKVVPEDPHPESPQGSR